MQPTPRKPNKADAAEAHLRRLLELEKDPMSRVIYTDGSQLETEQGRATGAALVVYRLGVEEAHMRLPMGLNAEVYDAEMCALASAAKRVMEHLDFDEMDTVTHLHFFADNSAAVERILDPQPGASQRFAVEFCSLAAEFLARDASHEVSVSWVPSHVGIPGNERADELAKEAAQLPGPSQATYSNLRRRAKEKMMVDWRKEWDENSPRGLYARASHGPPSRKPPPHFRSLPRRIYGLVTQCRLGHAFMGEYYQRHVPSEDVDCPCGCALQTRDHILRDCPRYNSHRHLISDPRQGTVDTHALLSTREGITALSKFIAASGAFTKAGEPSPPGSAS